MEKTAYEIKFSRRKCVKFTCYKGTGVFFFALNKTVNERKHTWCTATGMKSNVVALIRQR